jgi:hypothetical protein
VGKRGQLTLPHQIRSDVLEADIAQPAVGEGRDDLAGVVDGPVAVGQHEHKIGHE